MKCLLTAAAFFAILAGPSLAEDATGTATPASPEAQVKPPLQLQAEEVLPASLPRAKSTDRLPSTPSDASMQATGSERGGCHHDSTVYLTN